MINNWFKRWDEWWTRAVPPHSLALIRLGLGSYLIFYWALHLPRVELLFSTAGPVVPLAPELSLVGLGVLSPFWTYIIYLGALFSLILFTIGWDMRLQGLIIAVYLLYYYHLSFHLYPNTYHRLYLLLIIVLAFSGADRVYSLRMKAEKGRWSAWEPVSIWPLRIIAIQITATFTGVSYQKLWLPMWQQGEALAYPFIGGWATPWGYKIISLNFPMSWYDFGTKLLKFLQCALPIGFWIPKVRLLALAGASLFLIMVSVLLSIWWFLILIPCFIAFLPSEQIAKACQLQRKSIGRKIRRNERKTLTGINGHR